MRCVAISAINNRTKILLKNLLVIRLKYVSESDQDCLDENNH